MAAAGYSQLQSSMPSELHQKLLLLRVPELKQVCLVSQLTRQGRKQDLQLRVSRAFEAASPARRVAMSVAISSQGTCASPPTSWLNPAKPCAPRPALPFKPAEGCSCPCGRASGPAMICCKLCSSLHHCVCVGTQCGDSGVDYTCGACRAQRLSPFLVDAEPVAEVAGSKPPPPPVVDMGWISRSPGFVRLHWDLSAEQVLAIHHLSA